MNHDKDALAQKRMERNVRDARVQIAFYGSAITGGLAIGLSLVALRKVNQLERILRELEGI